MILLEQFSQHGRVFACDACPSGCGGKMDKDFFHEEFPPFIIEQQLRINAFELFTISYNS